MVRSRKMVAEPLYGYRFGGATLRRSCDLPVDRSGFRHVATLKHAPTTKTLKGKLAFCMGERILFEFEDGDELPTGRIERVTKDMIWIKHPSHTWKQQLTAFASKCLFDGGHLPEPEAPPKEQTPSEALASTKIQAPPEFLAALERFAADQQNIEFKLLHIVEKSEKRVEMTDVLNREGRGPLQKKGLLVLARKDELVLWDNGSNGIMYPISECGWQRRFPETAVVTFAPGDRVPILHKPCFLRCLGFIMTEGQADQVEIKEARIAAISTTTFRVEYTNPADAFVLSKPSAPPTDLVSGVATTVVNLRDEAAMLRRPEMLALQAELKAKAKARRNWLKAREIYLDQVRRAIAFFWLEETAKRNMHAEFDEAGNATLVGPGAVQEGEAFLHMDL